MKEIQLTEKEYKRILKEGKNFLFEKARDYRTIIENMEKTERVCPICVLNYAMPLWWYQFEYAITISMAHSDNIAIYYGNWDKYNPKHKDKIKVIDNNFLSFEYNLWENKAYFYNRIKNDLDYLIFIPENLREKKQIELEKMAQRLFKRAR